MWPLVDGGGAGVVREETLHCDPPCAHMFVLQRASSPRRQAFPTTFLLACKAGRSPRGETLDEPRVQLAVLF